MDDLSNVTALGSAYREACEARDAAMARLIGAVLEAVEAGAVKSHVIRASGLARQTVYDALR